MPTRPPTHRHPAYRTKADRDRVNDERRGSARQRGYDSRWERYRRIFLQAHPLCARCETQGKITQATVVDHDKPARERPDLFWEPTNHVPLCASCHSSSKQRDERRGYTSGCDTSGRPLDPNHPWNRRGGGG